MPDEPVQLDIFGQETPLENLTSSDFPASFEGEKSEEPNLEPGTYDPATVEIPF